jgi:hypothetical protein
LIIIDLTFLFLPSKVVDYLIDPFVAGTSAGDPESLSVSNGQDIWTTCISYGIFLLGHHWKMFFGLVFCWCYASEYIRL